MSVEDKEKIVVSKEGVIFVVPNKDNNTILLEYRDGGEKDSHNGLFIVPGGGFKNNENLSKALVRELKEETGVNLISYDVLKIKEDTTREGINRRTIVVVKEYEGVDVNARTDEGLLFWATLELAKEICEHPFTKEILEIYERSLSGQD